MNTESDLFANTNNWIIAHLINTYIDGSVYIPFLNSEAFPPDGIVPVVKMSVYNNGVKIWTEYE